jgi:hypothetical protein
VIGTGEYSAEFEIIASSLPDNDFVFTRNEASTNQN